ncbi:MAG: hypothetical protein FH756_05790 [Firmicutes bacterium]|nr:hypothetical protein [Bacillota bacterium]
MDNKVLKLATNNNLAPILLKTKMHIPKTRQTVISRPRLMQELDQGFKNKLTVITAPAGYGKSTLAGEWANKGDFPVAWVSLDYGDNDSLRFWNYVIASLEIVKPGISDRVQSTLRLVNQSPEVFITVLVNELCNVSHDFCLILDDYHAVKDDFVHNSLSLLIKYLPSCMHILISTRTKPPIPFSRFLIAGELIELTFRELRFTTYEISNLFKQKDVELNGEEIERLEFSTEGWPAGLQVIAYSLCHNKNKKGYMSILDMNNQHIVSYFAEEAFHMWPESIRGFLLQTSVLEQLTWELCEAVTGRKDGRYILNELVESSAFIIALDSEGNCFRYHHLFREFLYGYLLAEKKYNLLTLHRLAGEWYENNGDIPEAIDHFLKSNDYVKAAKLIQSKWAYLIQCKDMKTMSDMIEALPCAIVEENPELCLLHAWTLALSNSKSFFYSMEQAGKRLDKAEELCRGSNCKLSQEACSRLLGEIAMARAKISSPNIHEMLAHMRVADRHLPEGSSLVRSDVQINLGLPQLLRARYLQRRAGELQQAAACVQEMQKIIDRIGQGSLAGWSLEVNGELAYEFNDLEGANRLLLSSMREAEKTGEVGIVIPGMLNLARTSLARGMMDEAFELPEEAEKKAQEFSVLHWLPVIDSFKVRLALETGDAGYISRWEKENNLVIYDRLSEGIEYQLITLVRVLLFEGKLDRAMLLLSRLLDFAENEERILSTVEILNLQAIAYREQGKAEKAIESLERSLALGEKDGCLRIFIDEGRSMVKLLETLTKRQGEVIQSSEGKVSSSYVSKLLKLTKDFVLSTVSNSGEQDSQRPIKVLTERETEALRLLAEGLNNSEIARKMVVSVNTVKSHTANIYSKLMVKNRAQAIKRGRELGII